MYLHLREILVFYVCVHEINGVWVVYASGYIDVLKQKRHTFCVQVPRSTVLDRDCCTSRYLISFFRIVQCFYKGLWAHISGSDAQINFVSSVCDKCEKDPE